MSAQAVEKVVVWGSNAYIAKVNFDRMRHAMHTCIQPPAPPGGHRHDRGGGRRVPVVAQDAATHGGGGGQTMDNCTTPHQHLAQVYGVEGFPRLWAGWVAAYMHYWHR